MTRIRHIAAELVADAHAELGEGPVWEPDRGAILWVDILGQLVPSDDPRRRDVDRLPDAVARRTIPSFTT